MSMFTKFNKLASRCYKLALLMGFMGTYKVYKVMFPN